MFHKNTIEKQNGIEFTRRNRITLTNKIQISSQLLVLQYMLIIAGVYGTVFSLISGLGIKVNEICLLMVVFLATLYFFTVLSKHGFAKYGILFFTLIYLIAGYIFWNEIKNGFWHLENIYISKFNTYFGTAVLKYLVDDYDPKVVLTLFFIFVTILLDLIICYVILLNTLHTVFVIITVPVVLLPFTVGYIPAPVPLGIYLACVISIIGLSTTLKEKQHHFNLKTIHEKHNDNNNENNNEKTNNRRLEQKFKYIIGLKIGGFLSFLLLGLILLLSILFSPDFYERKFNVADTKNKIQKEMMEFNLEEAISQVSSIQLDNFNLFEGITASGGLSGGKLGRIGEVIFNNQTALRIKTPVMGTSLYLKGFAGSEYKGNYWDGLSKSDRKEYKEIEKLWENSDFQIGNQSSYFLSLIQQLDSKTYTDFKGSVSEIEVEGIHSNSNYIYAPYYSDYSPDSLMSTDNPEYVIPKKRQISYSLEYYNCYNDLFQFDAIKEYTKWLSRSLTADKFNDEKSKANSRMEQYLAYEDAYRNFVYSVYTRVPDTGLEQLKKDYGAIQYKNYKKQYGKEALGKIIDMVRENLNKDTAYSLNPGVLPKDKDFVEYFLYENKTGYCTHYASAAALIFRIMGIPARYVEGYIVKSSDILKGADSDMAVVKEFENGTQKEYQVTSKTIDIPDANAHAWVEIYIDGFGWVPVEVTPGFSGSTSGENKIIPGDDITITPSPEPSESKNENDTAKKEPEKTVDSADKSESSDLDKEDSEAAGAIITDKNQTVIIQSYLKKAGWILVWIFVLFIVFISYLFIRSVLIQVQRKKVHKTADYSKRVLQRYKEIRRVFDFYQINVNEDLTFEEAAVLVEKNWQLIKPGRFKRFYEIVLKAGFDKHCISKEEYREAEEFYQELINDIYDKSTPGRRFVLRFVKVFQ